MEGVERPIINIEQTDMSQNPPSTARHSSNSFLVTFLSILLLIACLIASFFAYQTQKLVKELQVMNDNLEPTPTTDPTPDPIRDWKDYTGSNFTFKYPPEWFVGLSDNNIIYLGDKEINEAISKTNQVFITIQVKENKEEVEFINKRLEDTENSNIKSFGTTIYEITDLRSHPIEGYSYVVAQTTTDNFYANIGLSNEEYENQFNAILSTFKFIEPVESASPLPVACTMDAKICPDGSAVGRSGPKCEFDPCPTPKSVSTSPLP